MPDMTKQLILLNGPPRSGKDAVCSHLLKRNIGSSMFPFPHWFRMSRPLKEGIRAFFGLTEAEYEELERKKDEPHPLLLGKSFRETQISLSEEWAKKFFAPDVFGRLAARHINKSINNLYISSDAGFESEIEPLLSIFAPSNILVIKLVRPGYTFAGDSRSYVSIPGATNITLKNDMSLATLLDNAEDMVKAWLARHAE